MIRREVAIFVVVGSLTVMIDFLAYRSLVWMDLVSIDISKAIGFLTGSVFAYFTNRFWTFGHKAHLSGSAWRFVILYAATLSANVFVNSLILDLFIDSLSVSYTHLTLPTIYSV